MPVPPSPELSSLLKQWCELQRVRYGADWKSKLAAEMAAQSAPMLEAFLRIVNK